VVAQASLGREERAVKFSIDLPGVTRFPPITDPWMTQMQAPDYQRVCRGLEAIGFDSIDVSEHLIFDLNYLEAMGGYWPNAMAAIAFVAGATERIRVNTAILILPLHHPVELAKAVSTLDVLCGGRTMLTVGLGLGEAQFKAMGVPHNQRGRLADEYLQVMQLLWTEKRPKFQGRYLTIDAVAFEPAPLQTPFPLWVGGNSDAALRRAVRFGEGWRPTQVELETLPQYRARADALGAELGRTRPLQFHIRAVPMGLGDDHAPRAERPPDYSNDEIVQRIGQLSELGVTWTGLPRIHARSLDEYLDLLAAKHGPIMAQCR
jgi:probable F420-dependent oxidoreductase